MSVERAIEALQVELDAIDAEIERLNARRANVGQAISFLQADGVLIQPDRPLRTVKDLPDPRPKPAERRKYSAAEKAEAVRVANLRGTTIAAEQLGIPHRSMIDRWRREAAEAGKGSGGGLEGTPADQPLDNGHQAAQGSGFDAAGERHPPATNQFGRPRPAAMSTALVSLLALLDHPEWIAGTTPLGRRQDGELWECDCGKRCRTIGQLRQHMRNVANPEAHHPDITAAKDDDGDEGLQGRAGWESPSPPASTLHDRGDIPTASPALQSPISRDDWIHHRAAELAAQRAPWPGGVSPVDAILADEPSPLEAHREAEDGLPFGCACGSRFPTAKDWSAHHKAQKSTNRNRLHKLVDQPPAALVDTGIPRPPHPAHRDPGPTVHVVESHRHQPSGKVVA